MTQPCASARKWDELVAWASADLDAEAEDALELHLMGCAECNAHAARALAVMEALRRLPRPIIERAEIEQLRAEGVRIVENIVVPGSRVEAAFAEDTDLLIHVLSGLELADAQTVSVTVGCESTGEVFFAQPEAPFDRERGEVLIACQRHFAIYPPDVTFDVTVRGAAGEERQTRYVVPHAFID